MSLWRWSIDADTVFPFYAIVGCDSQQYSDGAQKIASVFRGGSRAYGAFLSFGGFASILVPWGVVNGMMSG